MATKMEQKNIDIIFLKERKERVIIISPEGSLVQFEWHVRGREMFYFGVSKDGNVREEITEPYQIDAIQEFVFQKFRHIQLLYENLKLAKEKDSLYQKLMQELEENKKLKALT